MFKIASVNMNRFIDSKTLFNFGYDNYTLTKVKEPNTVIETIEIEDALNLLEKKWKVGIKCLKKIKNNDKKN